MLAMIAMYMPQLLTAAIALLQLRKDWKAHETNTRRTTVLALIALLMSFSAFSTYRSSKNTSEQHERDVIRAVTQHAEDLREIAALKQAVTTANENQVENTKAFLKRLQGLSAELSNIQTQVRTQELKKQAARLQGQLTANIKAMQAPKAELSWTFAHPTGRRNEPDITEITATPVNRVVHVAVSIINRTPTAAVEGGLTIRVCDLCTWATTPPLFRRLTNAPEQERFEHFEAYSAVTIFEEIPLDIGVPFDQGDVTLLMWYRCNTCIVPTPQTLLIHLKPAQS